MLFKNNSFLNARDFFYSDELHLIDLVVHFNNLLLKSLLELDDFLLMLLVVYCCHLCIIRSLLCTQQLNVINEGGILSSLCLHALVDSVHQTYRILDSCFDDRPKLLNQQA